MSVRTVGSPQADTPHGRAVPRASRRTLLTRTGGLLLGVAVLALLCLVSISVGAKSIPLTEVWSHLFSPVGSYDSDIVHTVRVPRTATGVVVGAALGLAGALMQALTRNPLADPGILGVNAGAFAGVVLSISMLGIDSPLGYIWFAFAGAAGTTVVVYVLGTLGRGGATPVRLALAGTAVGAALTALTSTIIVMDAFTFDRVRMWNLGSLAVENASVLFAVLPFIVVGCVLALALGPSLNAIALGEDLGRALGAHVGRTRALTAVAVTLLCGAATAVAGPIGFVGLMVPHAVRAVTGPDQRWVLPYSMVFAGVLLIASDIIGRVVARPGELEVGIVTAVLGGPALVLLVRRRKLAQL
ncbi:MAG: iron chelate uptake ABC transporter family permease subunit [Streptosporangiales bacterium]|nr:iron chelate uptake ABC transporter family permease subunit [Streptosporangiales bacterium]